MSQQYQHHIDIGHAGPIHHPLSAVALYRLIVAARATTDNLEQRSINLRIKQAVPGMVHPIHCAPREIGRDADEAVTLFRAVVWSSAEPPAYHKLCAILAITQGELPLGCALGGDWQPEASADRCHGQEVAA